MSSTDEKEEKTTNLRSGVQVSVALQILAMAIIVMGINIVGFDYYVRKDFSRSQKFVLSDQSRKVLRQLKKPLKVIVYFSPTSASPDVILRADVQNFLNEVQFAARKSMTIESVDPIRNLTRAREVQAQYKFGASENVVILDYDGHTRFIPVSQMAQWDSTPVSMGEPPRVIAFTGEQEFTTALISVLKPDDRKIYFLQGNGEPEFASGPFLSLLRDYITRQSMKALPLNLQDVPVFPGDAGAIVIVGARYDLSDAELKQLEQFWQQNGSLLVYLDPEAKTPKLEAFLELHGIKVVNDRVLTVQRISAAIIGIMREVKAHFIAGAVPTKRLEGANVLFQGSTQSLDLLWPKAAAAKLTLRPLIMASDEYWGEMDYVTDEKKGVKFDEGVDVKAPVTIAASAERGGANDEDVALRSAKLVVVGNKDCVLDTGLNEQNVDFFLNSMNWMLERGKLSGIAPKNTQQFLLVLNDSQTGVIALYTMIVIPGIAALMGIIAWWRRRR
ncbi:MAG: GldG family protein [Chthoniobacterales bacterium]